MNIRQPPLKSRQLLVPALNRGDCLFKGDDFPAKWAQIAGSKQQTIGKCKQKEEG